MKKSTLLAVAAMCAGSAFAQTEINGLKISEGKDTAQFHFYRIRNMRAMRLDYNNGTLRNMAGDSVNTDRGGGGFFLSETLEDGETPTPKISDRPYMGLSDLGGNWWLSFSNEEDVKNPDTEYWYFTSGGAAYPGSVLIQNAVITGYVSDRAKKQVDVAGYSRSNMDFNLRRTNRYYVLPVKPAFEATQDTVDWCEAILEHLTPEDFDKAFAFSLKDTISNEEGYRDQCLDMNNYINFTRMSAKLDENGDTVRDDNGNVEYYRYGFAGVDRTWSPVTTTSNKNHWENNGTLFFVEEVPASDALEAKKRYQYHIIQVLRDGAIKMAKESFADVAKTIQSWTNVPAIWYPEVHASLAALQASCENWNGEGVDINTVVDVETRDAYVEKAAQFAQTKLAEAATYVGTGCKVLFKNQLALRDLNKYVNEQETVDPELNLGNAYLTAGGSITYKDGSTVVYLDDDDTFEDWFGTGVVPVLEQTAEAEWELIPVAGTATFLLYNDATESYIRKYDDMFTYVGGEETIGTTEGLSEFSWCTTYDIEDACPFTFIACQDEEAQAQPSDEDIELMIAAGLDTDIENKVRLQAQYSKTTLSAAGVPTTTDYVFNIHRGSAGSDYKFINWGNTYNNWFADTNAFLVEPLEQGGISEVAADNAVKANGIYDLQGRRVSKADKGIYIINGVKTMVR